MILKRLGIGKKSEYFLEAPPLSHEESKVEAKKLETKQPEAKSAAPEPAKPQAESAPAAITPADVKAAQVAESPVPAELTGKSDSASTKQKKFKKAKPADESAAAPEAAPVAKVAPVPEPTSATFATDYLIPKNTPRRRPGPSLDMFKDMAKQVNPKK